MKDSTCNHKEVVTSYKSGETICKECGLVLARAMVDEPLRYDSDHRQTTGSSPTPLSVHDKDLGTTIIGSRDSRGKRLSNKEKRKMFKLQYAQRRARIEKHVKTLRIGLIEVRRIQTLFHFPQPVLDESAYLLRKFLKEKRLGKGQSIESLSGSIVYMVARKAKIPISMKEFHLLTGIRVRTLGKIIKKFKEFLGYKSPRLEPVDFIAKMASDLNVEQDVVNESLRILEGYKKPGAKPKIVAGGVIYYSSKKLGYENLGFRKLKEILNVSEPSIRLVISDLKEGNW